MIEKLYKTHKTVFTFREIAMILSEENKDSLKSRINYYVKAKRLNNVRKGLYCLDEYSKEELACKLYTPTYLSLEYVLQKEGVIFQYQNDLTIISYLSRNIMMESIQYSYRKIKKDILFNTKGIIRGENINIATKERAILDILYLKKDFYFDNLNNIDFELIDQLLEQVYCSYALSMRAKRLLNV